MNHGTLTTHKSQKFVGLTNELSANGVRDILFQQNIDIASKVYILMAKAKNVENVIK